MMDEDQRLLIGLASDVKNLTTMVEEMREDLRGNVVTKPVFDERNRLVDSRLDNLEKAKAPWWSVVAVIVAAGMLLWNLAQPLVQLVLTKG